MEPRLKLNIVLASAFALTYVVTAVLLDRSLESSALDEVRHAADLQMETGQAVRDYTSKHLRDLLVGGSSNFHPESVPSFAANTTMRYLTAAYPGYTYREVALNPTNPANRAADWERDIIERFRQSGSKDAIVTIAGKGAQALLHYAKPLSVSSVTCLRCHDSAAMAPPAMLARYGQINGFGWQLGETVGAQIVSIPVELALSKKRRILIYYLSASLAMITVLFITLNLLLHRAVLQPVQQLGDGWRRLASEDPLTRAANRRGITTELVAHIRAARETDTPLSALMLDIDHFKRINDEHGHAAGDAVLKELVERIRGTLQRPRDAVGRLGGEEFCIMLPHADRGGALRVADAIRSAIAERPFLESSFAIPVTASLGVAQWRQGESVDRLLARADEALYEAKHQGRNRVELAP